MISLGFAGAGLLILATATIAYLSSHADGPFGPIPGGELRSGPLERERAIELDPERDVSLIVLQTVVPIRSRTTGLLELDGTFYIPCDLGFIWHRVAPPAKWLMALASHFKRWHKDVLADGRVVLKVRGIRYERQAVEVQDPDVLEALRCEVERNAENFLSSGLGPRPAKSGPIVFFRLDPRTDRN